MNPESITELLHEDFRRRCLEDPQGVALIQDGSEVTAGALGTRVQALAAGLEAQGIGVGSVVGLHLERSVDQVVATLAVLEAGGAVMPLPPSYPDERIRRLVEFAGVDGVISGADTADALPPGTPSFMVQELEVAAPTRRTRPVGDPDRPAFVLASSGSTGRPKLIVRSHRSFYHRLRWTWVNHPYRDGQRCCQKSHITTTHAVYELFEPLLGGAPVIIVPDDAVRNLERFWELVKTEGISRLLLVPAQVNASLAMPGFEAPSLEVLVLMGEYVSPPLAAEILDHFHRTRTVYSIYGSTEASSTLVTDLRASYRPGRELPLGTPISPAITAAVLDAQGEPVPAGEIGRLHVSGPALFSGYLRDPEATEASLRSGPNGAGPLYDTGDDVRLSDTGELEFQGRSDHIIKIRGFRVDLVEVEGALRAHPQVRQAAVVCRTNGAGNPWLHAYVAPASVEHDAVFRALRQELPSYMLPSRLTTLEDLPRTPGGKVDRRRLEREALMRRRPKPGAEPDGVAAELAEIWRGVLEAEHLPPDRSFFEAGGTSLSAFVLVHGVRERFGLPAGEFDADTVYQAPTLAEQAAVIQAALRSDSEANGQAPRVRTTPVAVTLRRGRDEGAAPVFFFPPAGGTPGSYAALARVLETSRELVGLRDPFLWGERDPRAGFGAWVDTYLDAVRQWQPRGPYHLVAYSSGAPFAWEAAVRLREAGQEVGLLALVDPLGLDRGGRSRYGWWVMKATEASPVRRAMVRWGGRLRLRPLSQIPRIRSILSTNGENGTPLDPDVEMERAVRNRYHLLSLSALLELNTGLRYALAPEELDAVDPSGYLNVLRERVAEVSPEVAFETIEAIVRQYPLQVRAQECYQLRPFRGEVLLVQAKASYRGLVQAQIRPYVRRLRSRVIPLAEPSPRVQRISERWGATASHFRTMRDAGFVEGLGRELDRRLG